MPEPDAQFGPEWPRLLSRLREAAGGLESVDDWPREQLRWIAEAGVLGWTIPVEHGGSDVDVGTLIRGYIELASSCLVTTFVLTQFNSAVQRLVSSRNLELQRELLPGLATGTLFATVGISHLTTSRQHLSQPAVTVRRNGGDFVVSGTVPWVTGGPHADVVVTGGTCEDGRQVLLALPTGLAGVSCTSPAELLALSASGTASFDLVNVRVPEQMLIAGPTERVMQRPGGGGTGSYATSSLAIGLSRRAVGMLQTESERRADLGEITRQLDVELAAIEADLFQSADIGEGEETACSPESIRRRANSLVLRSTQAALTASKGAGFVAGHPAERAVREAMFFLVWSCPQPVAAAALREFACLAD